MRFNRFIVLLSVSLFSLLNFTAVSVGQVDDSGDVNFKAVLDSTNLLINHPVKSVSTRFDVSTVDVSTVDVKVVDSVKVSSVDYKDALLSFNDLRSRGVINSGGIKYTYYSQSVLPGVGLRIPGRHVNGRGLVADKDGFVVVASNSSIPKGFVYNTPFGKAKVYDRCGGCSVSHLDVYTK